MITLICLLIAGMFKLVFIHFNTDSQIDVVAF